MPPDVGFGAWLCKNPQTLNRDRRNYSSKTALVAPLASRFNLEVELKNIILVAFRFFEFSHSQGQNRKSRPCGGMSALLEPSRHVRKVPP
jgi:adenylate cyclase